jgi:hypothetical protein
MSNKSKFLRASETLAWLGQFEATDQATALELLQEMRLVSRAVFNERLRALILQRLTIDGRPVGLYAERELSNRAGVPNPLFNQTDKRTKRAYGVGPPAVAPTGKYDPHVGSEGIVAQLVSELCREFPTEFYDHPGPDKIRAKKIRRFVLVTDFIGSGKRALTYIEAAWRVRSVRSWWSARETKGVRFEVIAYSATASGRTRVEQHPSAPEVYVVTACPAIPTMSNRDLRDRLRSLCIKYDPINGSPLDSLGFNGTGALIAFAHGVPNNAPRILHKSTKNWASLFPARVTSSTRQYFTEDETGAEGVRSRLIKMRQTRLADAQWIDGTKPYARIVLTVLAALSHPPRDDETLSRKTALTILDIQNAMRTANSNAWINDRRQLTERGQAELANARKSKVTQKLIPDEPESFYYPSSLREPLH